MPGEQGLFDLLRHRGKVRPVRIVSRLHDQLRGVLPCRRFASSSESDKR
jgi:hypothetical protein